MVDDPQLKGLMPNVTHTLCTSPTSQLYKAVEVVMCLKPLKNYNIKATLDINPYRITQDARISQV